MELEEAIKILNGFIQEFRENPVMLSIKGIRKEVEYEAIETVLNHLKKQEKMIELMVEELAFGVFNFKSKEQAKQYFEKKVEEAEQ